jgi:cathepsin B
MMDDFSTYSGGVYQSDSDEPGQFHSIEIVGWGEEDGTPYWLAQNSFGDLWGLNGLFKILRGSNHLGIESYATAARPNPT